MTETTTEAAAQCAYCGATADLEPINPRTGTMACRLVELCALRAADIDPVQAVLKLARELAQLGWHDVEARNAAGIPGSPERRDYRPALSDIDRARLYLVLGAAAGQLHPFGNPGPFSGDALKQARAELGCRLCGAIGSDECHTASGGQVPRTHGTWGPRWHAGRTL